MSQSSVSGAVPTPMNMTKTPVSESPVAGSLLNVPPVRYEPVGLSEQLNWLSDLCGQVVRGGVYLCYGPPGSNKSTLARQIALDLARQAERTLFVLTEEPATRLGMAMRRMTQDWSETDARHALSHIQVDESCASLEQLPRLFSHQVMSPGGKYHGVRMIVIDSIQGSGLAASATRKWEALYDFTALARAAGVTVVLICHVTKKGEMAGPRSVEHNIDVAMVLRKAGKNRHLGVPKNRFGPEAHRFLPLELNEQTLTLHVSPHMQATASIARSYLPGIGVTEVQAVVTLPRWGTSK